MDNYKNTIPDATYRDLVHLMGKDKAEEYIRKHNDYPTIMIKILYLNIKNKFKTSPIFLICCIVILILLILHILDLFMILDWGLS